MVSILGALGGTTCGPRRETGKPGQITSDIIKKQQQNIVKARKAGKGSY